MLCDQIIEGLRDGDIIQELLQVKDLTLDQAITKCCGLDAAKKSRTDIQGSVDLNAIRIKPEDKISPCVGCGHPPHVGGRKNCPTYKQTCHSCGKIGHFSRVCRQKPIAATQQQTTNTPQTCTLSAQPHSDLPFIQLSSTSTDSVKPAPTVTMKVTTCNGEANIAILPDSRADICAAGPEFVKSLGEHMDNLAPSQIVPRAVNGSTLHPVGKIPKVTFHTLDRTAQEDVHIYDSVAGAIISWSTAQKLGILPKCYPQPITTNVSTVPTSGVSNGWSPSQHTIDQIMSTPKTPPATIPTTEEIMADFPSVFDG